MNKVTQQSCDYLVFDMSNILHRTFYANKNEDSDTIAGLGMHMGLVTCHKYYKLFRPKQVVMGFDRTSWRKEYTANNPELKPYKGNRRQTMTQSEKLKYEQFVAHIREFEEMITNHTKIITLQCDNLEADDLIAGFCQHIDNSKKIIVISADSDLMQLKDDNVTIISPATDKEQTTLKDYDNCPKYYLFHKCVRGDTTDNIASAFPRCRSTKIKEAYEDPFAYVNFMNEEWTDEKKSTHLVEDMFKHNQILIDLSKQPEEIRKLIDDTIITELSADKKFSYFHFLKFLGKNKLDKIKESIENYLPMVSS